jgi:AcrR family transcriptional regulator
MALLYYRSMEGTWNDPLPRGRHNLTREEVSASQRRRILMALLEEVATRGYAATSVAHITGRAGVSRKSFYEQFTDKQDCYFAAYDLAAEFQKAAVRRVSRSLEPDVEPIEYFRTILRAFLEGVAASPAASRTLLVEVYAVGPEAVARKVGVQHANLSLFLAPLGFAAPDGGLTFAGEAIVSAIGARITQLVAQGRADEVPDLCDPFVDWVARHLDCVPAERVPAPVTGRAGAPAAGRTEATASHPPATANACRD